jgi:hypothetical protein
VLYLFAFCDYRLSLSVQFPLQNGRALEGYDSPCIQHKIASGCRVSATATALTLHAEFPKSADEDILAGFKGLFYGFQKGFHDSCGFGLAQSGFIRDTADHIGLGKCHGVVPLVLLDGIRADAF